MDKNNVDLDKPFVADAPAGDNAETQKEGEKVVDIAAPKVEEPEKPRIPYSRFENVNRARREAEEEAEKWRQRALELEQTKQPVSQTPDQELSQWIKTYGDNEQSRDAYNIWKQGQERILAQAEERAFQRLQGEQQKEQTAYRENLQTLDEHLEVISDIAGHELTEKEEEAVLDIIDEYTAKDEDGNYLGAILPPDKAWELYELKQQVAKAPAIKARDNVANVINTQTSGQPSVEQQERDKNWRPWSTDRYPSG